MSGIKERISRLLKDAAMDLGFEACGITHVVPLEEEAKYFRHWLSKGHHATMKYMSRNVDKRLDPGLLNEWARSMIVVLYNYFPKDQGLSCGNFKISKYAYGRDYHMVIKDKLKKIVDAIEDETGEISSRVFVDSAPVLEKAWAVKCGLGWIGNNSCLISRQRGSFFFIGSIITNLDLSADKPEIAKYCGNCTKCMDACPNHAIVAPGMIDSGRCISYLSIEHKGSFSPAQHGNLHGWIFGCDICQDVCPWNRFSSPHQEPAFEPIQTLKQMKDKDWQDLDERKFTELFKGTALERTGYEGFRRNIEQVMKQIT